MAYVPGHHLEGSGTYELGVGAYEVDLGDTAIYEVVPHRTGKKGGFGLEFTNPTPAGT